MEYKDIFKPKTMAKLNHQSADNLRTIKQEFDLMDQGAYLSLLQDIMTIEKPYQQQLEQLAVNMVQDLYPVIEEQGIIIDAGLTDMNGTRDELDEDISPEGRRRVINAITQGASLKGAFTFYLFKDYIDAINDTLIGKYNEVMKRTFGVFDDDNVIAMMMALMAQGVDLKGSAGGSSKVILKEIKVNKPGFNKGGIYNIEYGDKIYKNLEFEEEDDKKLIFKGIMFLKSHNPKRVQDKLNESQESGITIRARAICFPMLVHEIIKGLYELISLQGFKGNKDQNQDTVNKVDTLQNEPHDIRYGQQIFEALNDIYSDSGYEDSRIREHFFVEIYQLDDEDFLEYVENAINGDLSPSQKRWTQQILKEIQFDLKDDDFQASGIE